MEAKRQLSDNEALSTTAGSVLLGDFWKAPKDGVARGTNQEQRPPDFPEGEKGWR